MRSRFLGAAAVIASTAFAFGAAEAPASAQPVQAAPARPTTEDVVYLRNGGFVRGRVTEIVPGDHVTVAIEGGETKPIAWPEVDRIVVSTGPTTPPATIPGSSAPAAPPGTTPTPPAMPAPKTETPQTLDQPPPDVPSRPYTQWRANRPLLVTGAILFGVGYGPNVVAAVPSTVGLAGRVAVFVLTLGLAALACGFGGSSDSYICEGQHGAMQLLVPMAGPFLFAADHPRDSVLNEHGRPLTGVSKALLYTSGGLQIAGIGSILLAVAFGKHEPVPGRKASSSSPSFFVLPQADAGSLGLTVGVHRW